ncbi:hypothetical protein HAX54_009254 [Datura stramonium]|uniref:Uncharacterized protein n=1 Tax=Datura stramonium TaxID=4076 RepID=A0ABS8RXU9_DATST|nr:hypothetical protein [Datura stramonium]
MRSERGSGADSQTHEVIEQLQRRSVLPSPPGLDLQADTGQGNGTITLVDNAWEVTDTVLDQAQQANSPDSRTGRDPRGALNLADFPALTPTPVKNGFEVLDLGKTLWSTRKAYVLQESNFIL